MFIGVSKYLNYAVPTSSPILPGPNLRLLLIQIEAGYFLSGSVASNFQDLTARLFPTRVGGFQLGFVSSLGEDARGELYITDLDNGSVFKIVPFTTNTAKADFNGDGSADILWQNENDGTRAIWLMNRTALSSAINIGSVFTE